MVNTAKLISLYSTRPLVQTRFGRWKEGSWVAIILFTLPLHAQVITDGTVGDAVTLSGQDVTIAQDLGTLQGNNLFHSFQTFNIQSNGSVTFTGANTINSVISRVTGGEISNIDGTLRSAVGQADFFFINPTGVVLSAGAKVDVPASFHVSTADALRFGDGAVYSATNPETSTLTIAAPDAFGFLGQSTGSILVDQAQLGFQPDSAVSMFASDITFQGSEISVDGGDIRIVAQGNDASTVLSSGNVETSPTGSLTLSGSTIDGGDGGGNIFLQAGDMLITDEAAIRSTNTGDTATIGTDIEVLANDLTISNGAFIFSDTQSSGRAGNVVIFAEQIVIDRRGYDNFTGIASQVEGSGAGGDMTVNAISLAIVNGGEINSSSFAEGDAGTITVNVEKLMIDAQDFEKFTGIASHTGIFSRASASGAGGDIPVNASSLGTVNGGKIPGRSNGVDDQIQGSGGAGGDLAVNASSLAIVNGGEISGISFAKGDVGTITFNAEQLVIDQQGSDKFTGIVSQTDETATGAGGDISVGASSLAIVNGGAIYGFAFGEGDAGAITVDAEQLAIDGQNSGGNTGILSETFLTGASGDIAVKARSSLSIFNGGIIASAARVDGDVGAISVKAEQLVIDRGFILSRSDSFGAAGLIAVEASSLAIVNGGSISGRSSGTGHSAAITVNAEQLMIDQSLISTETSNSSFSEGGDISVNSSELGILRGGQINASSRGQGQPGMINLNAGHLFIDGRKSADFTGIASTSLSTDAGSINVIAGESVMHDGQITTSTSGVSTNGGPITISGDVLVLNGGFIQANALSGQGGDIAIDTDAVVASSNKVLVGGEDRAIFKNNGSNLIQAVAPDGVNGLVNIDAPDVDVSGSLLALVPSFVDITGLAFDPCAAFVSGAPSTFTVLGRGGLPGSYNGNISFSLTGELLDQLLDDVSADTHLTTIDRVHSTKLSFTINAMTGLPVASSHGSAFACS